MSVPTWRQAEKYAAEASAAGDAKEAAWWTKYAEEVKDVTYDVERAERDGFITYDSGRVEHRP